MLAVLLSLVSLALIAIVTLQSGKEAGLSGALSGGSNDSYLSKSKTGNRDKLLASLTKWIALAFAVLALVLNLVSGQDGNTICKQGVCCAAGEISPADGRLLLRQRGDCEKTVQGYVEGGSRRKVMGAPVAGWQKARLWDQRAMGQPSSSRLYFRSPTRGRPRAEN